MYIKRGLLIVLFVLLMPTVVFAGTNGINRVYVLDSFEVTSPTDKHLFFLWSDVVFAQEHNADTVLLFSECKIKGTVNGNIYAIFSQVDATENGCITGHIYAISSPIMANLILSVFVMILCSLFMAIKHSFFEQGSVLLLHEPLKVIANGITFYFIMLALSTIFLLSVIGFPVTILLLMLLVLLITAGEVSISIMLGRRVADKITIRTNAYLDLFIGIVFVETVKLIPYIGWLFTFLVLPVFALGLFATNVINGFINKTFYNTDYSDQLYELSKMDNGAIRDKIMKQIRE